MITVISTYTCNMLVNPLGGGVPSDVAPSAGLTPPGAPPNPDIKFDILK